MTRGSLRIPLAAIVGAAVALVAASALGVASAEAPTTAAATRTVDVQGIANAPIGQGSNAAAATASYRTAMAAAVADAQSKAEFLATKAGVTLGAPQTIAEDGGFINCSGAGASGFVEYEGEQPDFGAAGPAVGVRVAAPAASGAPVPSKPAVRRHRRKHKRRAKAALAGTCTVTAQVSLAYAIS